MKRFSLVLGLALALSLVFVGTAYANFGPHGGYISDTDACAGCHRAHSSFSTITFDPKGGGPVGGEKPYALLVGSAATMTEFCEACHGDAAPGAATNVQSGRFDSGPSGDKTVALGDTGQNVIGDPAGAQIVAYETSSTFNAPLNGGGFGSAAGAEILDTASWEENGSQVYKAVTSTHNMEATGVLWGAGASVSGNTMDLTCTSCHDPHGSANYRLLKDEVQGNKVGGYDDADTPSAFVYSTETGYPTTGEGGWLKHQAGADQMAAYRPDYTAGSSKIAAGTLGNSMSAWCAGCHETYDEQSDWNIDNTVNLTYNYSAFEGAADGGVGAQVRHRHPVDITLTQGDAILAVKAQAVAIDPRIPLEVNTQAGATVRDNHVGCLTCHFAHGSDALMSGWSDAHLVKNAAGIWAPERDTTAGVEPDKGPVGGNANNLAGTSALLRADNRGVCERCHNK